MIHNEWCRVEFYNVDAEGTQTLRETKTIKALFISQIKRMESKYERSTKGDKYEVDDFTGQHAEMTTMNQNIFNSILRERKSVKIFKRLTKEKNSPELEYRVIDAEASSFYIKGGKIMLRQGSFQ